MYKYMNTLKQTEQRGFLEKLRHPKSKLGKWVVRGMMGAGIAGSVAAPAAHAIQAGIEHDRSQYEAMQGQIGPVIKEAMVRIDEETLVKERETNPKPMDAPGKITRI